MEPQPAADRESEESSSGSFCSPTMSCVEAESGSAVNPEGGRCAVEQNRQWKESQRPEEAERRNGMKREEQNGRKRPDNREEQNIPGKQDKPGGQDSKAEGDGRAKRIRPSLAKQMVLIVMVTLILLVVGAGQVFCRLEEANLRTIYHLTSELTDSSVSKVGEQMEALEDLIYSLIVCTPVQNAGSRLLEAERAETPVRRAASLNEITEEIQRQISQNHAVVCAEFIDNRGEVQTVASTRYIRLGIQAAKRVEEQAVQAAGDTILLSGKTYTGNENLLILAKEVREKKDLSLEHIGTMVLMVSVSQMASVLTDTFDGTVVMQSADGKLTYILGTDSAQKTAAEEGLAEITDTAENDRILRLSGDRYFSVRMEDDSNGFCYYTLEPYNALFSEVRTAAVRYFLLYLILSAAALALASVLSHQTTAGVRRFTAYIRGISPSEDDSIPLYTSPDTRAGDVFELEKAYNAMSDRINRLVQENYRGQILAKDAQLAALQTQMNPHFLYNSLNSIYWMAEQEKAPETAEMISSLSGLLRQTVSTKNPVITVDEELDIACQYISLQKKRFGDRMIVAFEVSESCSALAIPKFTLQPLIENAIVYGVERMVDPCTIRIRIEKAGDRCVCQVRDSGPPPEPDLMQKLRSGEIAAHGNGVSLLNIDARIRNIFGPDGGIAVFYDEESAETVVQASFAAVSAETVRGQEGKYATESVAVPGHSGGR